MKNNKTKDPLEIYKMNNIIETIGIDQHSTNINLNLSFEREISIIYQRPYWRILVDNNIISRSDDIGGFSFYMKYPMDIVIFKNNDKDDIIGEIHKVTALGILETENYYYISGIKDNFHKENINISKENMNSISIQPSPNNL